MKTKLLKLSVSLIAAILMNFDGLGVDVVQAGMAPIAIDSCGSLMSIGKPDSGYPLDGIYGLANDVDCSGIGVFQYTN